VNLQNDLRSANVRDREIFQLDVTNVTQPLKRAFACNPPDSLLSCKNPARLRAKQKFGATLGRLGGATRSGTSR
jgi:hypothetical protein